MTSLPPGWHRITVTLGRPDWYADAPERIDDYRDAVQRELDSGWWAEKRWLADVRVDLSTQEDRIDVHMPLREEDVGDPAARIRELVADVISDADAGYVG